MTIHSAADQLLNYCRQGYRQSVWPEQSYFLNSNRIALQNGSVVRGRVLLNTLDDDLVVMGLLSPWIVPTVVNANYGKEFSFNFGIMGSQERFFSIEVSALALFATGTTTPMIPYIFTREFIVKSNSGITFDLTDVINSAAQYFVQLCFVCYRTPKGTNS